MVDYERRHGTWWDRETKCITPEELMEGRFIRLFERAPAAEARESDLEELAAAMTSEAEAEPAPETEPDGEENRGMVAAFTYLGQFIDHDLTFDPVSVLRERVSRRQLRELVNFRTPRFDLDSLYGRGPAEQPYMYDPQDGRKLLRGRPLSGNPEDPDATDLPRGPNGRALIGDPRNDENRIVAQLHATMIRFHNRMADALPKAEFAEVRQQVRWHYQWMIVHDFLPTIIAVEPLHRVFPHLADGSSIADSPPRPRPARLSLMPVEFSVAAYRFGHSTVRPLYRLNSTISRRPLFSASQDPAADLGGFRPIPDDWAIDWQFFIDLEHGRRLRLPNPNPGDRIERKPQFAYKIDTSIVNPLGALPPSIATNPASLPQRNLQRGRDFGLPSGQTVAKRLRLTPLPDDHIVIGKAAQEEPKQLLTGISSRFAGNAPLWTYILSEAQTTSLAAAGSAPDLDAVPIRLGPVGGRLIATVFAALLNGDQGSFLHAQPAFTPRRAFTHRGAFGLAELINVALGRRP
jgi:hypothetical protein